MNRVKIARLVLGLLLVLGGESALLASGIIQATGEKGGQWVLTLADNPNAGKKWRVILHPTGKDDKSGSVMTNPPNTGTLMDQVHYTLLLEDVPKETKYLTFYLSRTNEPGYVIVTAELRDENSKANPKYKAAIKKFTVSSYVTDPKNSKSGSQVKPVNSSWELIFDLADLDLGDLILARGQKLSALKPK